MLVSELYQIFKGSSTKKEKIIFNQCPKHEKRGIWDILGYYDSRKSLVCICEKEIEKHSKQLTNRINRPEYEIRLVVRELVRLHEHAHGLLHTGIFGNELEDVMRAFQIRRRFRMGYRNLPAKINEPLTVFISWAIICRTNIQLFEEVFDEIDKQSPNYYRNWVKIKQLIDEKSKPTKVNYIHYIPGLVKIAREHVWNNFNSFIKGIENKYESIKSLSVVFAAIEALI